ncbi:MAG: pseudaminic acid synthase [Desulfobacterales bacterium]
MEFKIKNRLIKPGNATYIIAELSANHDQDFNRAVKLIKVAKEIGADAVKLQTYSADTITINCDNEYFRINQGTLWGGRTLYDLYSEAHTPWDWQPKLNAVAEQVGIDLFSSPFDETAVDFLEKMHVPAYKIASFEIVDLPLIQRIAQTGKPIIMSTGMATLAEIEEAIAVIRKTGNNQIALLKCTSAYPASPEEMNLNTISHLSKAFTVPVGISDHTLGIEVPLAAVALGACIVEKHFTLSRSHPGPDSRFSLEPHEFKKLIEGIRIVEQALGGISYGITEKQKASRLFRRSLFVVEDIKEGHMFTRKNIRSIRPGNGLHTRYLDVVLGKKARINIDRGTPLSWDLIA